MPVVLIASAAPPTLAAGPTRHFPLRPFDFTNSEPIQYGASQSQEFFAAQAC
jgi:hypothetical protein